MARSANLCLVINEDRLIGLFRDLCLIDAPARGERESVAFTRRYLESAGFETREDNAGAVIGGNANNLIVKLPANAPGRPTVFLSAHFDTVEPTAGLEIIEADGVFRSGSETILGADDKGGMAPAIEALLTLRESGDPHGDVYLLLSVAEEIGLLGAQALDIQSLGIDFGYVLDTGPPVGTYVTRAATHDRLEIILHGRAAHAGKDPENGVDTIQMFARAVAGMRLGRIDAETTANIGIVEAGTAVNVVCPRLRARAEARSTDPATLDAQVGHMIQRFEAAASEMGGTAEIEHRRHYGAYTIPDDSPVVRIAQSASRALGMSPASRVTLGGSDANAYNAKGVPTIVLATGMQKIHTHDEFIARQDLVDTARLALEILRETGRQDREKLLS